VDEGAVAAWASRFEADRAAALAYRAELHRDGRPTDPALQAKQLGLSVALTDPERRCDHYGDRRFCSWCSESRSRPELERENRRLEAQNERMLDEIRALRRRLGGRGA
jgi:hypothetical protein